MGQGPGVVVQSGDPVTQTVCVWALPCLFIRGKLHMSLLVVQWMKEDWRRGISHNLWVIGWWKLMCCSDWCASASTRFQWPRVGSQWNRLLEQMSQFKRRENRARLGFFNNHLGSPGRCGWAVASFEALTSPSNLLPVTVSGSWRAHCERKPPDSSATLLRAERPSWRAPRPIGFNHI